MANLGISDSDIVQNQFTAYLLVSLHRNHLAFRQSRNYITKEVSLDESIEVEALCEDNVLKGLSVLDQLDNHALTKALMEASQQTRDILFMKIFKELTFPQIAEKLGIHHKNVSAIYYRTITKLKKAMEE